MSLVASPSCITAQTISHNLGVNLITEPPSQGLYLVYDAQGLGLANAQQPKTKPVRVDFSQGSLAHRLQHGGGRGQALAKACGLKAGISPKIFDATLGLATDACVLASLGCQVMGTERHPWVAALIQDALERAAQLAELGWLTSKLRFVQADSTLNMADLAHKENFQPEVVYLDPMFPSSNKTAQVKKNMQFFQELVGQDLDADQLLGQALQLASHRVVVKRPKLAPYLADKKPSFSLVGKANRFDIYALRGFSAGA